MCLHTGATVRLVVKCVARAPCPRISKYRATIAAMDNIILLGFLFAIVGLSVYLVMIYNGLVVVKNDIDKAWANIDVMLKQRHDELPKLIEVCKGYMNFERDTLQKITEAAACISGRSPSIRKRKQIKQRLTRYVASSRSPR